MGYKTKKNMFFLVLEALFIVERKYVTWLLQER